MYRPEAQHANEFSSGHNSYTPGDGYGKKHYKGNFASDAGDMSGAHRQGSGKVQAGSKYTGTGAIAGRGKQLIFPTNLTTDPTQMNHMMFTIKEITGGRADARTLQFARVENSPVICLPIPSGLNTSYQQAWGQTTVSGANAHMVGSEIGQETIKGISGVLGAAGQPMRQRTENLGGHRVKESVGGKIGDLFKGVGGTFETPTNLNLSDWSNYLGGMKDSANQTFGGMVTEGTAMMAAGPLQGIAEAAQYTAGMRAVNQAIMSYSGPGFRNFSYNFSFKPFSIPESDAVYDIIQAFKIYSAPDQLKTKYTRVYNLPAVFKIQFYHGAQEHRQISRIGHCALTNISVAYGGSKFSTFSGSHSPTQVDLTLNFQELELLNRQMVQFEEGTYEWPEGATKGNAGSGWATDFI